MNKASKTEASMGRDGAKEQFYAIGIGSNRSLGGLGPRAIVQAAFRSLDQGPLQLVAQSSIIASRPIGPSTRTYANATAIIRTALMPIEVLDQLQAIEQAFHRRRYRRWGARTLDLDLLLWSGGKVREPRLTVPHPAMKVRGFVLQPLRTIAPRWRDPATGLTVAQLTARIERPKSRKAAKPVDRKGLSL